MRRLLLLLSIYGTLAAPLAANPAKIVKHADAVGGQYIVLLPLRTPVEAVDGIVRGIAASYHLEVLETWQYALRGFLCKGALTSIDSLSDDPRVDLVEQQFAGNVNVQSSYILTNYSPAGRNLWYLDRLDQATPVGDDVYYMCPDATYAYNTNVYVYVIDYDIRRDHESFQGRVTPTVDFSGDACSNCYSMTGQPANCYQAPEATHATEVASAITGWWGAARAQVVPIKVLRCNGAFLSSNYLSALNWIASPSNPYRGAPGVINHSGFVMSWANEDLRTGFRTKFPSYDVAVSNTVPTTNFPYFAAAGNFAVDACNFTPQDLAYSLSNPSGTTFVVGGTDINDARWQLSSPTSNLYRGSNYGNCVTAYAPAEIYASDNTTTSAYSWQTGTSYASPLAAALAARYIAYYKINDSLHRTPTYRQVYDFLLSHTTSGTLGPALPSFGLCGTWLGNLADQSLSDWWSPSYSSGTCPNGDLAYVMAPPSTSPTPAIIYWAQYQCP